MIISEAELAALAELRHARPHDLLGMHLADGGVVVRALLPETHAVAAVKIDGNGPVIPLRRLGETNVFEGHTTDVSEIFLYELAIEWSSGEQWRTRDAYSFKPTIGDQDLCLFGQGDEIEKLNIL